jgi:hypothetical protein
VGARPHPADRERRQQIGALGRRRARRARPAPAAATRRGRRRRHETEPFLEALLHVAALLRGHRAGGSAAAASSVRP